MTEKKTENSFLNRKTEKNEISSSFPLFSRDFPSPSLSPLS
jgi:hypothetical protein